MHNPLESVYKCLYVCVAIVYVLLNNSALMIYFVRRLRRIPEEEASSSTLNAVKSFHLSID